MFYYLSNWYNSPIMQETPVDFWVGKIRWRRDRLPTPVCLALPCSSAGKEWAWNVGVLGLIPGLGWSPGEGKGYHFSILAWRISWAVSSMGSQRVGHNWVNFISLHFNLIYLYCSTIVSLINSVREYVFISVLAIQIFTHLNCLVSFCM